MYLLAYLKRIAIPCKYQTKLMSTFEKLPPSRDPGKEQVKYIFPTQKQGLGGGKNVFGKSSLDVRGFRVKKRSGSVKVFEETE